MPNQTIPITLTWGASQSSLENLDLNQLGTLIAQQMSAAMRADVTFIPQLIADPATFQGQLIFNIVQRIFKGWDAGTGTYKAVTEYAIGDTKTSFVGNDTISTGWVVLDGRLISSITGITGAQQAALESIFGVGASLPTVIPQNISGLPDINAFGNIPWPPIIPAAGVIGGITFTNPVVDTEAKALADQTELLRDTVNNVQQEIQASSAVSQSVLSALYNNTNPPMYVLVFCGFQ
jgi:hypothetical protein